MKLSIAAEDRIREALAAAALIEARLHGREPKGHEIVFRALAEALFISARLPDPEARWLKGGGKSAWPVFALSDEDRMDAYRQLQWLVLKVESPDILVPRSPVSPREHAVMDAVFEVFRALCVGKNVKRDWILLQLIAGGFGAAQAGKKVRPRISARSAEEFCRLQCIAVAHKLCDFMPSGCMPILNTSECLKLDTQP
jgi:hypothetical protein